MSIVQAAKQYQLEMLKNICEKKLCNLQQHQPPLSLGTCTRPTISRGCPWSLFWGTWAPWTGKGHSTSTQTSWRVWKRQREGAWKNCTTSPMGLRSSNEIWSSFVTFNFVCKQQRLKYMLIQIYFYFKTDWSLYVICFKIMQDFNLVLNSSDSSFWNFQFRLWIF